MTCADCHRRLLARRPGLLGLPSQYGDRRHAEPGPREGRRDDQEVRAPLGANPLYALDARVPMRGIARMLDSTR